MMIVTYYFSAELLQSIREDLIRPMLGVISDWSLMLRPVYRTYRVKHKATTTRSNWKIRSIPWSSKWLQSWRTTVPPKRSSSTRTTILENSVQYWNFFFKKKGRWKSDNSIVRHEKSERLTHIQSGLNKSQLTYFEVADLAFEENVLRSSLMMTVSSWIFFRMIVWTVQSKDSECEPLSAVWNMVNDTTWHIL